MIGKTLDRVCAMKTMATNKERKLIEGLEKIKPDELVYMPIAAQFRALFDRPIEIGTMQTRRHSGSCISAPPGACRTSYLLRSVPGSVQASS